MKRNKVLIKQIATSIILLVIIFLALHGTLDNTGESYTDDAFKRSLVTFGIARGLNGVISVAQGTEVALHPAGFGVNFTPGQVLDPINDLVEQFSWVMLAASASLGIQKIFLSISSTLLVSGLLLVLLCLYGVSVWRPGLFSGGGRKLILSAAVVALFMRFSVPLAAIGSELLYDYFLKQQYTESTLKLENTMVVISSINTEEQNDLKFSINEGVLDKAKRFFNSATASLSLESRLEKYKESATEATTHAINLIVVFIIQTILFPLLFLWMIYRSMKLMWANLL
ncbi:MAG: hypothetical protein GXP08_17530 [Gammaproteobacteria bacterium]|nr:hypothetical protein [Gammaproteobacteria bacterium]